MMRFPTLFIASLLWAAAANAERKLPADLQVDLIFPRNETYAPTQLFPIVFGVDNLDAVWPLDLSLQVTVESTSGEPDTTRASWKWQDISLGAGGLSEAVGPTPGKQYFYFPSVNMTNGTTDSYSILWQVILPNRCFDNSTNPRDDDGGQGWSNSPNGYASRGVRFSTAQGAPRPDIEATINSCPEPDAENSAAVRITEVRNVYDEDRSCPVLEENVKPAKCAFKAAAKELAANISVAMLDEMRCEEGAWQDITAPCSKKSTASLQNGSLGMGWILSMLAFVVLRII